MEPIYTYRKGEGWVYGIPDDIYVVDHKGHRVTFEHRRPVIGERFYYLHKLSSHIFNDKLDFKALFKSLSSWSNPPEYNSALLTEENQHSETWQLNNGLYTHVVLTVERIT